MRNTRRPGRGRHCGDEVIRQSEPTTSQLTFASVPCSTSFRFLRRRCVCATVAAGVSAPKRPCCRRLLALLRRLQQHVFPSNAAVTFSFLHAAAPLLIPSRAVLRNVHADKIFWRGLCGVTLQRDIVSRSCDRAYVTPSLGAPLDCTGCWNVHARDQEAGKGCRRTPQEGVAMLAFPVTVRCPHRMLWQQRQRWLQWLL